MPIQENTINSGIATTVASFLEAQAKFIAHLQSGRARVRPANRLWPIFVAHRRELQRRVALRHGTLAYYNEMRVLFYQIAVVVSFHIEHLEFLIKRGKKLTRDQRRATRFLNAAFDDIMAALDDLGPRFPKVPLKDIMYQIVGGLFPNLSPEEITRDLESIRKFIRGAITAKQKEQEQKAA